MLKNSNTSLLLCILLICLSLLFVGCNQEEPAEETILPVSNLPAPKVDAPKEVLQLAQARMEETKQLYTGGWNLLDDNGKLMKIKIMDAQITNLQLVKRVDIYDHLVGQRVIDGIQSAYNDFYIFSFRFLPDREDLEKKNVSFELDEEGWISFEEITPYTSDTIPGPLFLVVSYIDDEIVGDHLTRATEFEEGWYEAYERQRILDYDELFTEETFSVTDEYSFVLTEGEEFVTLGLGQKEFTLPEGIKENSKKLEHTDYFADYLTRISYEVAGGKGYLNARPELSIETLNYNMPDSADALAKVIYIGTNSRWNPQTYRGIAVGDSEEELLRLYPDDLYYLPKEKMVHTNDGHPKKDIFDYAYFYFPHDGSAKDITFYMSEGTIAYIEMISAYERRYVYDEASDPKNLVNKPANKKSVFQVETAGEFSGKLPVHWTEIGMPESGLPPHMTQIHIRVPKVSGGVSNGVGINRILGTERYMTAVEDFQAGDFSLIYKERYARYIVDYQVHRWKGAVAFVLDHEYGIIEAGGGKHRTVWYYDINTGNILSPRQYAKKCGVSEEKIIEQYNSQAGYGPINSVYEANFYIDEAGKVITFENYDT